MKMDFSLPLFVSSFFNAVSPPISLKNPLDHIDPFNPKHCGIIEQKISPRILGGIDAQMEYPWFALLRKPEDTFGTCGGTLITNQHVLTAAHCFTLGEKEEFWKKEFVILVGVQNCCNLNPGTETFGQKRVILHNKFSPKHLFSDEPAIYDIALIKLDGKSMKTIICLPSRWDHLPKSGTVLGYGHLGETATNRTCVLQEANLDILRNEECAKSKNAYSFKKDDNFCAKSEKSDSCKGDSGGPFEAQNSKGRYTIYGVVSLGFGCGHQETPGFYTNVISYLTWIKKAVTLYR